MITTTSHARRLTSFRSFPLLVLLLLIPMAAAAAQDDLNLIKKSQNPISNLISVPLENNFNFGVGPKDSLEYVLNMKPVYPVKIGSFTLINRMILPVIYQEGRFSGESDKFGLGDLTYQAFLSPNDDDSPVIWGVGPAFAIPTATDKRLGPQRWSLGPAFVAVAKPGPWLVGGLIQNLNSFAGPSNRPHVDFFSFQYFINYNFEGGWFLASTPTITANWEASSSNRWTLPFGGGGGRLVRIGGLPISFQLEAFGNAVKPDGAADWTLQFLAKLLFPQE